MCLMKNHKSRKNNRIHFTCELVTGAEMSMATETKNAHEKNEMLFCSFVKTGWLCLVGVKCHFSSKYFRNVQSSETNKVHRNNQYRFGILFVNAFGQ